MYTQLASGERIWKHPTQLMDISGCTPAEFIAEIESLGYRCHNLHGAELVPYTNEGAHVKPFVFLPI